MQPRGQQIQEAIRRLRDATPTPQPGDGWRDADGSWMRVVGQICAIGSSRSWTALSGVGVCQELTVSRIRALGPTAATQVHRLLASLGIRYCSPAKDRSLKAEAIVANARSLFVASAECRVLLLDNLVLEVGDPAANGVFSREQSRQARRRLIKELRFFGPKSASDFLLGLGLSDSLLAFDVRLLNLLIDSLGWDAAWRRRVGYLSGYESLEDEVIERLCKPMCMSPLLLDRVLFYHYKTLRQEWAPQHLTLSGHERVK